MPHYTALVTLLAVALYFYTGLLVAKARQKFGVVAPATTCLLYTSPSPRDS